MALTFIWCDDEHHCIKVDAENGGHEVTIFLKPKKIGGEMSFPELFGRGSSGGRVMCREASSHVLVNGSNPGLCLFKAWGHLKL